MNSGRCVREALGAGVVSESSRSESELEEVRARFSGRALSPPILVDFPSFPEDVVKAVSRMRFRADEDEGEGEVEAGRVEALLGECDLRAGVLMAACA